MNKLKLLILLLACVLLLNGCAYLPVENLVSMYSRGVTVSRSGNASAGNEEGDTVTMSREAYEQLMKLAPVAEMVDIAKTYYYEEVDEEKLYETAVAGALAGLGDHYSFYYDPEDYAKMWEEDEGKYAGVGMQISASYTTGLCTITRVFAGSPAREAGIQRGDILYKVEDMYVSATNLTEAVNIMRGIPGTDVKVIMLRGGDEMEYTLTRAEIQTTRAEGMMLPGNVGYIAVYEFAADTVEVFTDYLTRLQAEGMKGLIIDLRDNGGGWVTGAQELCNLFLERGVVCYLQYKDGTREYYRTRDDNTIAKGMPLVLLVNEATASSSEITTGCLRDRADATVVGVNTYGKGIVQSVMGFGDKGAGLQITVAQYFTPNGCHVHKVGLAPDIEIALPKGDNGMYELGDLNDVQLSTALEVMNRKLAGEIIPQATENPTATPALTVVPLITATPAPEK